MIILLYFLSDNGGAKSNASNNAPLNSHKGTLLKEEFESLLLYVAR